MTRQSFTRAYPAELRERGVRLFRENRAGYASDTAAGAARLAKATYAYAGAATQAICLEICET